MATIVHFDNIEGGPSLTGSIPTEIGMLTKLTSLALSKWMYCLDFFVYLFLNCTKCISTNLFSNDNDCAS